MAINYTELWQIELINSYIRKLQSIAINIHNDIKNAKQLLFAIYMRILNLQIKLKMIALDKGFAKYIH